MEKGGIVVEQTLLSVLVIGLLLGIKHAIEPDHIVAVSTLVNNSRSLMQSSIAGVLWGVGHSFTIFLIAMIVLIFKVNIPDELSLSFELLVGIMIILLGVSSITNKNKKYNQYNSSDKVRIYKKSTLVGFIHGLAGSSAMIILTVTTVSTIWESIIYMMVFGIGTVVGMLGFTFFLGLSFVASAKNVKFNQYLTILTGTISIIFGVYYTINIYINM